MKQILIIDNFYNFSTTYIFNSVKYDNDYNYQNIYINSGLFPDTIFILVYFNKNYYLLNNHSKYKSLSLLEKQIQKTINICVNQIEIEDVNEFINLCIDYEINIDLIKCDYNKSLFNYFITCVKPNHPIIINITSKDIINYIEINYPSVIKESNSPIKPNINKSKLLEELNKLDYNKCVFTKDQVFNTLNNYNNKIKSEFITNKDQAMKKYNISDKSMKLIESSNFYIGVNKLDAEELSKILFINVQEEYELTIKLNNLNLTKQTKKKPIDKNLRLLVWNHYIGENIRTSKCTICEIQLIKVEDFECAHIIAEAKGGETILTNLTPSCKLCNRSMGTQNAEEYKQKINNFLQ